MNDEYLSLDDLLPDPPKIEKVDLDACRSTGDFRPILFEYYRNIAILVAICGNIKKSSPDWLGRSREYYVVQVGLLNRMQRILAGHLEFFQDGRYGDLTLILDRCLLETAVKALIAVSTVFPKSGDSIAFATFNEPKLQEISIPHFLIVRSSL